MVKLNWKIWLLILCIIGSLLAIIPLDFTNGVEIASVASNSTAFEQGLKPGEIITAIDGNPIINTGDYRDIINSKFPSDEKVKLIITTSSNEYILFDNQAPDI